MEISHIVKFSTEEIEPIFEIARKAGEHSINPAYSAEEREKFVLDSLEEFTVALTALGIEAFSHGHLVGRSFPIK